MMMTRSKRKWFPNGKGVLSALGVMGLDGSSFAARFGACELKKKHGAEWAQEDKAIYAKLAALEEKFGKNK